VLKGDRVICPYFGNVMLAVKYLPMLHGPWDCINRAKL